MGGRGIKEDRDGKLKRISIPIGKRGSETEMSAFPNRCVHFHEGARPRVLSFFFPLASYILASSFSLPPHPPQAAVSAAVRGSGGVTDVLMWLRFLITTQLKAPFALVRRDRWEAEAERRGDAMLTNGRKGIWEAEEVEGGRATG